MADATYPCPCCGYLVFSEPPGSYDICPICYWEDDALQLEFATTLAGGANHTTLGEAQANFERFGACEERLAPHCRPPGDTPRDPAWRPVDPARDRFEDFESPEGVRAPRDLDALYYWRPSFRLRRDPSPT
ncbi:MAG TPA: CPCC family cysteine-rich protein [Longimicrobium sp.]